MENPDHETTIPKPSVKRRWSRFANASAKNKHVLPAIALLFITTIGLEVGRRNNVEDIANSDEYDQALTRFLVEDQIWETCQRGVEIVNGLRLALLDVYEFIEEQGSEEFAENLRNRLDLNFAQRSPTVCGERPTPPERTDFE